MTKENRLFRIKNLRRTGIAEGASFLILLFIAMPLKYLADMPEMVKIVGWLHGILFILYLFVIVWVRNIFSWPILAGALAASVVPFGTLILDKRLKKYEQNQ